MNHTHLIPMEYHELSDLVLDRDRLTHRVRHLASELVRYSERIAKLERDLMVTRLFNEWGVR